MACAVDAAAKTPSIASVMGSVALTFNIRPWYPVSFLTGSQASHPPQMPSRAEIARMELGSAAEHLVVGCSPRRPSMTHEHYSTGRACGLRAVARLLSAANHSTTSTSSAAGPFARDRGVPMAQRILRSGPCARWGRSLRGRTLHKRQANVRQQLRDPELKHGRLLQRHRYGPASAAVHGHVRRRNHFLQ